MLSTGKNDHNWRAGDILNLTDMKNLFLLILLSLLVSCSDWLDFEPESNRTTDNFYKTPYQMEQALLGVYNGLLPFAHYYLMLSDVRSDDVWTSTSTSSQHDYVDISTFTDQIYVDETINDAWESYYVIVNRANTFIEKIRTIQMPEGVAEKFEAEARFLRALAYFELVRNFGRVPLVTRTISVEEAMTVPQSEAKDIYESVIIPDLKFAVEVLDDEIYNYKGEPGGIGRATQIAAQALLARVFLTMAGFPLNDTDKLLPAMEMCEAVIQKAEAFGKYFAKTASDWERIWVSDNDNRYHIFEIQYTCAKGMGNTMVFYAVPKVSKEYTHVSMSGYAISASDALVAVYDESDIRKNATLSTTYDGFFTKFFEHMIKRASLGYPDIDKEIVDRTYFPINYPIVRLEDVMLMYAEIEATISGSPSSRSIALVNKIRARAGLPELTAGQSSPENFLMEVDRERRRELAGEGVRWYDIVRHNTWQALLKDKFDNRATAADYSSNLKGGRHLLPIPDYQMKTKKGLYVQNPGW